MGDSMFNTYTGKSVYSRRTSPEEDRITQARSTWQRELKFGYKENHGPEIAEMLEKKYRKLKKDREDRIAEYKKNKGSPAWCYFLFWAGVLSVFMNCAMYCSK